MCKDHFIVMESDYPSSPDDYESTFHAYLLEAPKIIVK